MHHETHAGARAETGRADGRDERRRWRRRWTACVSITLAMGVAGTSYVVWHCLRPEPLQVADTDTHVLLAPGGEVAEEVLVGAARVCVQSDSVRLTGISFAGERNDQPVRAYVRHVSAAQVRAGSVPTELASASNEDLVPLDEATVVTRCERAATDEGFDELIVAVSADAARRHLDIATVHYSADGRTYDATIDWPGGTCEDHRASEPCGAQS